MARRTAHPQLFHQTLSNCRLAPKLVMRTRGGGPWPSAHREAGQVSHGGPPPDTTTRRARMRDLHSASVSRFMRSPSTSRVAISTDRTQIA
eukprot:4365546-Pyramimonas_sp.AAC.2